MHNACRCKDCVQCSATLDYWHAILYVQCAIDTALLLFELSILVADFSNFQKNGHITISEKKVTVVDLRKRHRLKFFWEIYK